MVKLYTCPECRAEYSHNDSYKHYLSCSYSRKKAHYASLYQPLDSTQYHAGYGLCLNGQSNRPQGHTSGDQAVHG